MSDDKADVQIIINHEETLYADGEFLGHFDKGKVCMDIDDTLLCNDIDKSICRYVDDNGSCNCWKNGKGFTQHIYNIVYGK